MGFKQRLLSNKVNLIYTGLILFTHFVYGICVNILGPTLVDLRFIYNVSIDTSSYIPVATSVGYLLGSLVGWLYRWLNRQLVIAGIITLLAVTTALFPHYPSFWVGIVAFVANGLAGGAWDAASGFWMVEMWPVGNAGLLQFMQFMYGVGTVLAPLIMAPYVRGEATVDENGRNITAQDRVHSLTVPFIVTGIGPILVPILLLILFVVCRYKVSDDTSSAKAKEANPYLHTENHIANRKLKLAICGLCIASYATIENGWFNFSTAMYQYLDIKLDATTAAHMQSVVSATYTLGRLTTTFIAIKVVPDVIISYHYVTMITGMVTIFLGRDNKSVIVVGSAILGYGLSAMWPAILAFTERHLRLSDRVCSIYSFLSGFASLITPLILGQTFKAHPMILFVLEAVFICISLSSFILVRLWIARG